MTDDEVLALVDDSALRRSVPAVELAEAFLERLEGARTMHAMTTITPELALRQARKVDERRSRGERLPLDGMPIVIKDNSTSPACRRRSAHGSSPAGRRQTTPR